MPEDTFYQTFLERPRVIYIVDPDLSTCETLSVTFRLEGYQTAFFVNFEGVLAALQRHAPDSIVANLELGDDDGLILIRRVRERLPGMPMFMLENRPMVDYAVAAMKAGATDVLTKPIDSERLVRGIRDAMRQAPPLAANLRPTGVRGFSQLTPREREVLQLITRGQSNKEAGRELGISPRTIEVHRARVMEKLGAKNTADLMRIVLTS